MVTAPAVAPLDRLAGLAAGLVRRGGLVLAIKGAAADEEVTRARPVLRRLGMRDVAVVRAGEGKVDRAADSRADGRWPVAGPERAGIGQGEERGGGFRSGPGMARRSRS